MDEKRALLRHMLATIAYRTVRALEDSTPAFAAYAGAGKRPDQILAHMGDLFDCALSMFAGQPLWQNSAALDWDAEQLRFFGSLRRFDEFLAGTEELHAPMERLAQGPVADALTHVGQLAMLRRMAGTPTRGENFYVASIATGQTGPEQPGPVKTF